MDDIDKYFKRREIISLWIRLKKIREPLLEKEKSIKSEDELKWKVIQNKRDK